MEQGILHSSAINDLHHGFDQDPVAWESYGDDAV